MGLLSLEHSKVAYRADFALYGTAVAGLAAYLWLATPAPQRLAVAGWVLAGLAGWTAIEYAMHRFVLHGMPPFRAWHALHHARPTARIGAPTLLSGSLIVGMVFLPLWILESLSLACAFTLGVLAGYLAYAVTHHAVHHGRYGGNWVLRRKRWHAQHHQAGHRRCYGVTSSFWDRVFGTDGRALLGTSP